MAVKKPIRVFYSQLSQRFYATRAWKQESETVITVTGEKFDVTNDIAALVLKYDIVFSPPLGILNHPDIERTREIND